MERGHQKVVFKDQIWAQADSRCYALNYTVMNCMISREEVEYLQNSNSTQETHFRM